MQFIIKIDNFRSLRGRNAKQKKQLTEITLPCASFETERQSPVVY